MIVHPEFTFVFNPHTGSRSLEKGFISTGLCRNMGLHTRPKHIPKDRPVYAMVRNTVDWVYAFYWNWKGKMTLEQFLKSPLPTVSWAKGALNPYKQYVDRWFIFEDGLENVFKQLDLSVSEIPHIGNHAYFKDSYDYPTEEREIILRRYEEDEHFYKYVTGAST